MKKRIVFGLIFSLIICMIVATTVLGASTSSGTASTNYAPSLKNLVIDKRLVDYFNSIKPYLKSLQEKQTGSSILEKSTNESLLVQPLSPASPLTYLQIYAASSTQHPDWEIFSDNQTSSIADHGGVELYIVTVELGYGHNNFARMNSSSVPLYDYASLDLDGDRIVDGYMYQWNASGYNSGTFTYQSTSINSPWNTMYDSIYIR